MNTTPAVVRSASSWRHQAVIGLGMAIALGGLAYLAGRGWPLLSSAPVFTASAPTGCDLHAGPCAAVFEGGRLIRLEMEPKTLPANQPLRILVETAGFAADRASVEFRGTEMNMGLISAALPDTGEGAFAGEVILPVCVRRAMAWQATVVVSSPAAIHRASFVFEVNRR